MNLLQIAIAFDQLINTLLGGMADETLSARAYRMHIKGKSLYNNIINTIFFWQKDHCKEAYNSEVNRKQLPDIYNS